MRRNLFYALFALSLATANAATGNTMVLPQSNNQALQIVNHLKLADL